MQIYKILTKKEWEYAKEIGCFKGSKVDREDGYIHFSKGHQVKETAEKHFKNIKDLLLLTIDSTKLNQHALRFEKSRGGDVFPHLYGILPLHSVIVCEALTPQILDSL